MLLTAEPYDSSSNFAVVVDSDGVRPYPTPPRLYDLDVSPDGRHVAMVHWVGRERYLELAALQLNR